MNILESKNNYFRFGKFIGCLIGFLIFFTLLFIIFLRTILPYYAVLLTSLSLFLVYHIIIRIKNEKNAVIF